MYLLSIRPCNGHLAGHQIGFIGKPAGSLASSIPVCTEQASACGLAHVHIVTAWSCPISPTPILSAEIWFLSRANIHINPDFLIWIVKGPVLQHMQHNPPGWFPNQRFCKFTLPRSVLGKAQAWRLPCSSIQGQPPGTTTCLFAHVGVVGSQLFSLDRCCGRWFPCPSPSQCEFRSS